MTVEERDQFLYEELLGFKTFKRHGNKPRSLPDWVERGYQILSVEIADAGSEGLPRDRAREELLAHGGFPDEPSDAEYAIDHLLNSGWLYDVDGRLRITDPELERDKI